MDNSTTTAPAQVRDSGTLTYLVLGAVAVITIIFAFSSSVFLPNNWYSLFKTIHVVLAVIWVGGGVTIMIHGIRAQRANDTKSILTIAQQAAFMGEKVFAPSGLVVFVMGIAMMINTNWGWGHFWVIAGLIGYASTFAVGIGILSPLAKQIARSAQEKGPEHADTLALVERIMLVGRIDVAVLLLVIVDMTAKPFA